ncbi:MAG: hypothetical protein ACTSU7_01855 [Candidatus Heimdallarchaeaceae archaeon]
MVKYQVILPSSGPKPSYYQAYIGYIKGILEACDVNYTTEGVVSGTKFLMKINEKTVVIDYSDHPDIQRQWLKYPYFKFHYSKRFYSITTMKPFAPISFYDWSEYRRLKEIITYDGKGNTVLCMQEARAGAKERRKRVRSMLEERYNSQAILRWNLPQTDYWKMINDCLVHVFVPGARNDMLDRGQMQYLAFGCCTIAPPIVDELPYSGKMISGVNYVQCREDYSDLIEKIEWCRNHREKCVEIGRNAKKMFDECCTPNRLWKWMQEKI